MKNEKKNIFVINYTQVCLEMEKIGAPISILAWLPIITFKR